MFQIYCIDKLPIIRGRFVVMKEKQISAPLLSYFGLPDGHNEKYLRYKENCHEYALEYAPCEKSRQWPRSPAGYGKL